jgi:hypothetical protein
MSLRRTQWLTQPLLQVRTGVEFDMLQFLGAATGRSGLSVRKHTATADRVLQSVNPNVIHRGQVLRIPQ